MTAKKRPKRARASGQKKGAATEKDKGGRPAYEPPLGRDEAIMNLAARGIDMRSIAASIGVSEPTLRKYHGDAIRAGRAKGQRIGTDALFDLIKQRDYRAIDKLLNRLGWGAQVADEIEKEDDGTGVLLVPGMVDPEAWIRDALDNPPPEPNSGATKQ